MAYPPFTRLTTQEDGGGELVCEHQPLARGKTREPGMALRAVVGSRVLRMARQERTYGGDVGFRTVTGTDGGSAGEFVVDKKTIRFQEP